MKHLSSFVIGCFALVLSTNHSVSAQTFNNTRLLPAATPVASSPMPVTMVADAAGNTYVAGGFRGTAQFGNATLTSTRNTYNLPSLDLYVAKLDPQGNFQWAVRLGSSEDDESIDLVRSSSGALCLLGRMPQPAAVGASAVPAGPFIARLDEQQGAVTWAVPVGNITCNKLATNAAGDVLLAGYSSEATITIGGSTFSNPGVTPQPPYYQPRASVDGFVAKLNAAGAWQWVRQLAAPNAYGNALARSVALDAQGNAYMTGAADNGTALDNLTVTSSPNDIQNFVAKLSPTGTWLWIANATTPATANYSAAPLGARVVVSPAGNVYWLGTLYAPGGVAQFGPSILTASPGGYGDVFLAKLTPQGQFLWASQSTGNGTDTPTDLTFDSAENAYVTGSYGTGSFYGSNFPITFGATTLPNAVGSKALFVAKIGANGMHQWAIGASGDYFDQGMSVGVDNLGMVYVTGTTTSTSLAFGSTVLNPSATAGYGFWTRVVAGPLANAPSHQLSGGLQLYPNPTRGAVSIAGPDASQPVHLFDALGREVLTASMPAAGSLRLTLPGTLPTGVYVVRSGQLTQRLIIE